MSKYKASSITDTSDLEVLKWVETASAVNELTVTSAATTTPPTLSATGDDTNIDLKLDPKGTGSIIEDCAGEFLGGSSGGALTLHRFLKATTAIADATATAIATVTVPNGNHSAVIRVLVAATLTGADAYESTRVVEYKVVLARTTGANVVAAIAAVEGAQIATVAAGATLTTVLDLSSITGAVGATNTFTIRVTNTGSVAQVSKVSALFELLNQEATGVTIA